MKYAIKCEGCEHILALPILGEYICPNCGGTIGKPVFKGWCLSCGLEHTYTLPRPTCQKCGYLLTEDLSELSEPICKRVGEFDEYVFASQSNFDKWLEAHRGRGGSPERRKDPMPNIFGIK
jgi:hypothetical protein